MADNPQLSSFRVEELDRNRFLLAEMYNFRFESPDSAFNHYDLLVRQFPESDYAPKALFNIAYLYKTHYNNPDQENRIYQTLIQEYGETEYGNAARKFLDLDMVFTQSDSLQQLFIQAESVLLDEERPDKALQMYRQIWERSQKSEYEAKAMYAIGYVYETYLDSLNQAQFMYDSLMSKYPESRFANIVQPKIQAVQKGISEPSVLTEELEPDSSDSVLVAESVISMGELEAASDDSEDAAIQPDEGKPLQKGLRMESGTQSIRIHLDLMAQRRREIRRLQMDHSR